MTIDMGVKALVKLSCVIKMILDHLTIRYQDNLVQ